MTDCYDLAIVGGGPAGQAAAEQAITAGLSVVMFDEQARMGGQILRQPPAGFRVTNWLPGRAYRDLKEQLARAQDLPGLVWRGRTSVVGALPPGPEEAGFRVLTAPTDGGPGKAIFAGRLLVAGGCYDLPVPLPGWTLPGVTSAGAVQAFVKSQRIIPGECFLLAGTHPLQIVLADQLVAAGGKIVALAFAQTRGEMLRAIMNHAAAALGNAPALLDAGGALARLGRARVPILYGRSLIGIEGSKAASAARLIDRAGRSETLACDRVSLCYGFLPQADLPRSLGAKVRWIDRTGGWATVADEWQTSSIPSLYVAGETTGVAGAPAALEAGRIAGLAIAVDAGRISRAQAERIAAPSRARLARFRRFAAFLDALADPSAHIARLADANTVVCRCEDVRRGALDATLAATAAPGSPSALKLVSRAGMGLCQGRGCEAAILRLTADRLGCKPGDLPGFTPRLPVRPVAIGAIAID